VACDECGNHWLVRSCPCCNYTDKEINDMVFFGIDPGKSGAIVARYDDALHSITLDATEWEIAQFLSNHDHKAFAVIEKVSSSPQMGVVSAFSFGRSYGMLLGMLSAFEIPFEEVRPQVWQKHMGCMSGGDKNVTKRKAQQLWPKLKLTHKTADAYLLAEYARQTWKAKQ